MGYKSILPVLIHGGESANETSVACCINPEKKARVFLDIYPNNYLELARVLGINIEDLPERLKHYGCVVYTGNSILSRLDPVENINTPYDDLRIKIRLCLSVEAINEIRLGEGLSKLRLVDFKETLEDLFESGGFFLT